MSLQSCLLCETVQLTTEDRAVCLNSAPDPFATSAVQRFIQAKNSTGVLVLAEDHIAAAKEQAALAQPRVQRVAFHDYISHQPAATMDTAIMNLLYQPGNAWIMHGLHVAAYALRLNGTLYVQGAKDRGILSTARRMEELFGNVETLLIGKGQRVVRSHKRSEQLSYTPVQQEDLLFADGKLDEGTRMLLEAIEVNPTDMALDIGCGAGFIGLQIARLASQGQVTMVDVSLAAVDAAQHAIQRSSLTNVRVLPSDGVDAVRAERFDLIATNPPFHQGGIHTTATAEDFIRGAARVLRSHGRFYLVANRFLKYEPALRANFQHVQEVLGDTRYRVFRATAPLLT